MKTEIILIVDRSGSMASIREETQSGIDSFVADQQKVPGDARMTLAQFDSQYEVIYQAQKLEDVPKYKLFPRGVTALLDAVGKTLEVQGRRIHEEKWADKVLVCIVTDGEENSSREYTKERVKVMIEHAQKHGWEIMYIGANVDAFAVGDGLGIATRNLGNYQANAAGTQSAWAAASYTTSAYRGVGSVPVSLNDEIKRREQENSA